MRTRLRLCKAAASSLALAGLIVLPHLCSAQESRPQTLRIVNYHIKPDMLGEWESLVKNEVVPAYKKAGVPFLVMWETTMGQTGEYIAVANIANFADLDGPSPLAKALAPDALLSLLSRGRKCVLEARSAAVVAHPELSIENEMSEAPAFAIITTSQVAQGHRADFQNFIKNEVLPAYKKGGVQQYWVYETLLGGDLNEWTSVLLFKKYAELEGGPLLAKLLGQDGYWKAVAKLAGVVNSTGRTVVRYRADLSATP